MSVLGFLFAATIIVGILVNFLLICAIFNLARAIQRDERRLANAVLLVVEMSKGIPNDP